MFQTILIAPLFNLLVLIYALIPGHDFGLAVIILTILVRLAIWPLVAKQLHSQRAMQSLSPDIAKIKVKSKGDKQKESELLLELYKERGINPLASLIPLFIQLPLLFALFFVLRDVLKTGEIAHVTYGALKQLPTIKAVIADNAVFKTSLFGLIDLAKPSVFLAVLSGLAQFVQTKQMLPKATPGDKAAATTATTMLIFPVITFVFALRLPAALALYWTVTSLIAIVQQHIMFGLDVREMENKK